MSEEQLDMYEGIHVEILNETENEDGSVTMEMDISEEAQGLLLRAGFRSMLSEYKDKDKVIVVKPTPEFSENVKDAIKHELTDEESHLLLQLGFTKILDDAMKQHEGETA
jgi:hypothetical protein